MHLLLCSVVAGVILVQPCTISALSIVMVWYGMVLQPSGHPPHIKHAIHLLYVWSGSGMSMKWMGGPNHILQHVPVRNQLKILRLCPLLLEWWYGMVLWHYDCQPWLKAFKHFLCMKWICMSMKWMGGPNHILQHVPSEKPRQNPTTLPTPSRVMVWYGVVALWLPAMFEGF